MRTPAWCRKQAAAVGPSCEYLIGELLTDNALYRLRAAQGVIGLGGKHDPAQRLLIYLKVQLQKVCRATVGQERRPSPVSFPPILPTRGTRQIAGFRHALRYRPVQRRRDSDQGASGISAATVELGQDAIVIESGYEDLKPVRAACHEGGKTLTQGRVPEHPILLRVGRSRLLRAAQERPLDPRSPR